MTGCNQQIVTAFEQEHLSPEQIAEAFEFDVSSVKAVLLQCSTVYRKASKKNVNLDFTDDEAAEMKSIIVNLARETEDEHLKFKAAKFVYEDKKGRLDVGREKTSSLQINIVTFNERMKQMKEAEARTIALGKKDVQLIEMK